MSDQDTAQQYPDPGWLLVSRGIEGSADAAHAGATGAESVEARIERLRTVEAEEWVHIEELGPSEDEMAELRVPPPPEMFQEDWRKQ